MTPGIGPVRRPRRVLAPVWLLVIGILIGVVTLSLALFTSQNPVTQPFSVGTITLGLTPQATLVSFSGMVPGNESDGALTVRNDGTGDLRYSMTAGATDADGKHLRDVLTLNVERRTGCAGTVLESLYSGGVATAAFGDPLPGSNPGDRTLAAGTSETLCFRVALPVDTDVIYQGATTTLTLTFNAEQVDNNP